jgi:hypothetical protein
VFKGIKEYIGVVFFNGKVVDGEVGEVIASGSQVLVLFHCDPDLLKVDLLRSQSEKVTVQDGGW